MRRLRSIAKALPYAPWLGNAPGLYAALFCFGGTRADYASPAWRKPVRTYDLYAAPTVVVIGPHVVGTQKHSSRRARHDMRSQQTYLHIHCLCNCCCQATAEQSEDSLYNVPVLFELIRFLLHVAECSFLFICKWHMLPTESKHLCAAVRHPPSAYANHAQDHSAACQVCKYS